MKQEKKMNTLISIGQQIAENTGGLCCIGPGPGGLGVTNPKSSEICLLLVFDPEPVQGDVLFPEFIEGYTVRTAGFEVDTWRELSRDELQKLSAESKNPATRKIADTVLALSNPQYVSTKECVEAFRQLADEETQEICEEPQTGMNGPMM